MATWWLSLTLIPSQPVGVLCTQMTSPHLSWLTGIGCLLAGCLAAGDCIFVLELLTTVGFGLLLFLSFFFLILIFFISWRLITLQYCSGFCHTLTWISRGVTCVLASLSIKESCYSNPKEMKCWESLFCSDFSDSRIPQGWLLRASCGNPCLLSSGLHSH